MRWHFKSPAWRLFTQACVQAQMKETSKLRVTGLCEGNSPVTGEFSAQRENVSIWWRHHEKVFILLDLTAHHPNPFPSWCRKVHFGWEITLSMRRLDWWWRVVLREWRFIYWSIFKFDAHLIQLCPKNAMSYINWKIYEVPRPTWDSWSLYHAHFPKSILISMWMMYNTKAVLNFFSWSTCDTNVYLLAFVLMTVDN